MSRAKQDSALQLDGAQRAQAAQAIKGFMDERFELELGLFEAEEVLDFCVTQCATHFYNKAILDVQAHLKDRFESIESDLWALEKP